MYRQIPEITLITYHEKETLSGKICQHINNMNDNVRDETS